MNFLSTLLKDYSPFDEIRSGIVKGQTPITVTGVTESQKAHLRYLKAKTVLWSF